MAIDFFSPEYQEMIRRSKEANPYATMGPSPNVDYGYGAPGPIAEYTGEEQLDYYTNLAHSLGSYIQGRADLDAQGVASGASAAERIRQQLIEFGIVPQGFQDKYGWVNNETRQLAEQNTTAGLSTYARIQKAFKDAQRRAAKLRAARGMARSGETGYAFAEGDLLQRQNLADASGKFLNANRSVYDQYNADFMQRSAALRALETDSFNSVRDMAMPQRAAAMPAPAPTAPAYVAPAPTVNLNPALRRFGHSDEF